MWEGYKVIDGDAHMQGAMDIWDRFMPKEYYDRRPIVVDWEDKMFFHYAPGEFFPEGTWRGGKGLGRRLSPPKLTGSMHEKHGFAWEADFSAESRLQVMDLYGWDKMVCFTGASQPLRATGVDQDLMWAATQAWNNWAHDFCQADPTRLKMVGALPEQHDIEGLVAETRRVIEKLGAVTVSVPMAPEGKDWSDPEYDAFWSLAEELDVAFSFHGVHSGRPSFADRYAQRPGPAVALHQGATFSFENMMSMAHIIYYGILERHPGMRVSFLEGSSGWLPFWLGRMDDLATPGHRQSVFFDAPPLPLRPSEYFMRQGFVACDSDERALKAAVDLCGPDNIIWNTDYPHPDGQDPPTALPYFLDQPISKDAKQRILWDNSVRLYGERILS